MNLGINLALGSAAMMGRGPDPNDIRISGSRVCKLWSETCPSVGTTTPSVATLSAVLTTGWTLENVATPVLQVDGSYLVTCNGAGSVAHLVHSPAIGNGISAPAELTFRIRNSVGLIGTWLTLNASTSGYFYFDGTYSGSLTVVSTSTDGTWRTFTIRGPATAGVYSTRFAAVRNASSTAFTATTEAYYLQILGYSQIRASAQNNLARADDGTLIDSTGGVQTTIANQPLILDQNGNFYSGASGQIPVVTREAGRTSVLTYTDPDVVGMFNGVDPPIWCAGIWKGSGNFAAPLQAILGGSLRPRDCPIELYGGDLYTIRDDAISGGSDTLLLAGGAALFSSWSTWALIRSSDHTVEFWHQGQLKAQVTAGAQPTLTVTQIDTGLTTSTAPAQSSLFLMAGPGQLPGATAAARYAQIRYALLAACARYASAIPGLMA